MDCAGEGAVSERCAGPAKRRCGAVAYCSLSHQEECERFKQQMMQARVLIDFPFREATDEAGDEVLVLGQEGFTWVGDVGVVPVLAIGQFVGMSEICLLLPLLLFVRFVGSISDASDFGVSVIRFSSGWDLPSMLCPCKGSVAAFPESKYLSSWNDYCKWRDIPLHSPVTLLLQRPLLIYWAVELVGLRKFSSGKQLCIHYLGPEKELLQVAAFGELRALFPDVQINIDIIGPTVPKQRDSETIELHKYAECAEDECKCKIAADTGHSSPVILHIRRGYYHDVYRSSQKDFPHLVIAPNAGIAAYTSWLPTIELINELKCPLFSLTIAKKRALWDHTASPLSWGNL